MTRLALLLALLLAACGDDSVAATTTDGSSSGSTGIGTTTTGDMPTTGDGSSTTTTTSTASGSDSETTSYTTTSSTGDTTQGVATTSTTGDDTTTGTTTTTSTTGTTTTTGTTGDTTTGDTTTSDTTTGGELEQPVPGGMCFTNDLTSFVEPLPQVEELHIVSVYQATGGAITVAVTRTDVPLTLVLSSYEPVAFTLVLAPGVLLEHVILNGYNAHTVQGQGMAMVTDVTGGANYFAACGYFWPENDSGCDTPGLVAGAEALTGLTLSSFVGCYEGSSFSLD